MIQHVCLYGPRCSGVIAGVQQGGAERQVFLFARYLASQGLRVTILDPCAEGSAAHEDLGIDLVKPAEQAWRPRGVPSIATRAPAIAHALDRLAPDACYMRGFWAEASAFVLWSRRARRPFVMSAASGLALDFGKGHAVQTSGMPWRDRLLQGRVQTTLARSNLRHATMLLAQHRGQVEPLRRLNPHVAIVPNIFLPDGPPPEPASAAAPGTCAWVGSISPKKGVADLIELARQAPEMRFLVAGAVPHPAYEALAAALAEVPNITYLGSLPAADVIALLARSAVLVNTSLAEGFPNTFLEAWWAGRPVASLRVDPGGVVRRSGAGFCADGSVAALAAYLRTTRDDPGSAAAAGKAGRRYVREHHFASVAGPRLLLALQDAES
jgi:glycosyltransferase involved in cell wall biosynthesis